MGRGEEAGEVSCSALALRFPVDLEDGFTGASSSDSSVAESATSPYACVTVLGDSPTKRTGSSGSARGWSTSMDSSCTSNRSRLVLIAAEADGWKNLRLLSQEHSTGQG